MNFEKEKKGLDRKIHGQQSDLIGFRLCRLRNPKNKTHKIHQTGTPPAT